MDLYPAIDLLDGKCVRLAQGDFERAKSYNENPVAQANIFASAGAQFLHIVDLDAARTGQPVNRPVVGEICSSLRDSLFVQVGGGVRGPEDAKAMADLGVNRVVVGTAIIENPELAKDMTGCISVAAGLDFRDGKLAVNGWQEESNISVAQLLEAFEAGGIKSLVATDILRDGMLKGPNLQFFEELLKTAANFEIIASGGVADIEDLKALAALGGQAGLSGAIVGRALYEDSLDLEEALNWVNEF